MSRLRSVVLLLIITQAACSATSKVKHATLTGQYLNKESLEQDDLATLSGMTYRAAASALLIDRKIDEEGKPLPMFSIVSIPYEAGETTYVAYPTREAGVRTSIGATYFTDTRLLKSLSVQVKDDRQHALTALGSVVTTIGALATPGAAQGIEVEPIFPIVLETAVDLKSHNGDPLTVPLPCRYRPVANGQVQHQKHCGLIRYGAVSNDAVKRSVYMAAVKDEPTSTFPVPACRPVTVVLSPLAASNVCLTDNREKLYWPGFDPAGIHLTSVVIDPEFVRVIAMPVAGEINLHPACGVDVVLGDDTTQSGWEVIAELATQM